jgi:hypothetical protein
MKYSTIESTPAYVNCGLDEINVEIIPEKMKLGSILESKIQ